MKKIVSLFLALLLLLSICGCGQTSTPAPEITQSAAALFTVPDLTGLHIDNLPSSDQYTVQISYELEKMLVVNGKEVSDLNDSPELLLELQNNLYEKLYTTLRVSECSGAYFVLDATTNTQAKTQSLPMTLTVYF